ncbi:MAG: glycosyltransferase family 2 protein, partial [Planctomycetaceae bacterium]
MIDRWMLWLFWGSVVITVYTQLGYPLLMRCLARAFGRTARPLPPLSDSELPSVSLVISAFNEEVVLDDKLRNALEIDYPRDLLEIVVASDGSRDRTVEIAQSFVPLGIRLLAYPENRGKATTLTEAVATVRGDVLLLCDANVMFRPDALRLLVERLRDPAVGAVTGDVRLDSGQADFGEGESLYYRIERGLQLDESALGSIIGVDGGMYVLRRELFPGIPATTLNDDFLLSMRVLRAGFRVLYEPRAVATETATMHAEDEFRRRIRVAAGAAQILRRGEFPPPWQPLNFFCWVSHKLLR